MYNTSVSNQMAEYLSICTMSTMAYLRPLSPEDRVAAAEYLTYLQGLLASGGVQ